jgi:hypothetical protein
VSVLSAADRQLVKLAARKLGRGTYGKPSTAGAPSSPGRREPTSRVKGSVSRPHLPRCGWCGYRFRGDGAACSLCDHLEELYLENTLSPTHIPAKARAGLETNGG